MPSLEANQLLAAAVDAADSKKAEDVRILALDPSESSLTDYFLICSGTNDRQNVAISDEIEYRLKKDFGVMPNSVEGRRQGEWVLMDYVDFVVHIFKPETREYYGLERLRKTATTLTLSELNSEIKAAVTRTRAKSGGTTAKADVSAKKVPAAVKKAAAKKTSAKKTTAESAPSSDAMPDVVRKSAAKKVTGKKTSATKASIKKIVRGKRSAT